MSYDKIKSIGYNKKTGECTIVGAMSNLYPIEYSKWEVTLNIYSVFEHVSTGNFHILPSLKRWDYLTTLVCKWYGKTKEYEVVKAFDRAECKVFRALVDRAMALPIKKLAKTRYEIRIDGELVVKFFKHKCMTNHWEGNTFDLYTLLEQKSRYGNKFKYKKVA